MEVEWFRISGGAKLKAAWDRFDWEVFKAVTEFTEDELNAMPEKIFVFERRIYDVLMIVYAFFWFTIGGAFMYENITRAAVGFVPFNIIQVTPLLLIMAMAGLAGLAIELRKRVYERVAGKGDHKNQREFTRRRNVVSGLPQINVLDVSPGKA